MVTVGGIKKVGAEASVVAASQAMEMPQATNCPPPRGQPGGMNWTVLNSPALNPDI